MAYVLEYRAVLVTDTPSEVWEKRKEHYLAFANEQTRARFKGWVQPVPSYGDIGDGRDGVAYQDVESAVCRHNACKRRRKTFRL